MKKKQFHIMISSGGTGGHMSPAGALTSDLLARGFRVSLMTDRRGRRFDKMFSGIPVFEVRAGTVGFGVMAKIRGLSNLAIGLVQAVLVIGRERPDLVIGFGGYPSVPGVWAAQRRNIPTILHEQNAVIGKANAMLMPKAVRIALSMPDVRGLGDSEDERVIVTGNPVRSDISDLYVKPYRALGDGDDMRIFVMGGSLGAGILSRVVPQALACLPDEYKKSMKVIQQCREADMGAVRHIYDEAGINAVLATFFDDVAYQLEFAHLVIARSGASTVAEVSTAGRPAIYVPYGAHKDNQQKMNADAVADHGGAWVMTEDEFTQEALLARMETFFQNPEILFRAAEKARAFGKPDAARKLGNLVTAVVSGWRDEKSGL